MTTEREQRSRMKEWRHDIANNNLIYFFLTLGTILISVAHFLHSLNPGAPTLVQITVLSIGSGCFMAGFFNVTYAAKTRKLFSGILADVVPTIEAGFIVHPSHTEVVTREDAISKYLKRDNVVRLFTSTGDNYFKDGDGPNHILRDKIVSENCGMKVLLDFPVFEQADNPCIGQRRKKPQDLINEHRALMSDYEAMIKLGDGRVIVRFFTVSLHTNMIM